MLRARNLALSMALLFFIQNGYARENGVIKDPPNNLQSQLLSERLREAKLVGIVKIVKAEAVEEGQDSCGYSFSAKVINGYKGVSVDEVVKFTSFQPGHFLVGFTYLIFFSQQKTTLFILNSVPNHEFLVVQLGERVGLRECANKMESNYADDENAFRITPSLQNKKFSSRWIVVNTLDTRIDGELHNDISGDSPCTPDTYFQQCIKISEFYKFVRQKLTDGGRLD